MREYFRILSSISITLILVAVLASLLSGVIAIMAASQNVLRAFMFPFVVSWIGFLMFGVIGSALWTLIFNYSDFWKVSKMIRQSAAALISMFVTLSIFCLFSGLSSDSKAIEYFVAPYLLAVVVFPVVLASIFIYKFLYVKGGS
ncbi:hypothetical protein [uncultured Microbulbifer sp.]|uniref:hypothetical protein n=1 Tax=uncultured Microbulbifer sp. TaxID=348147 RepID=UPI002612C3D4|nr:hypothetical protein [uncultured Microbulbifer sp.]